LKFEVRVHSQSRDDFVDITPQVQDCVRKSGTDRGICVIFVPHTTAGLTVNENWDPAVKADTLTALDRLVPRHANYQHVEGNAAAHIKSCLMGTSVTLLIESGTLMLGEWQGVFLAEFDGPRSRRVLVRVIRDLEEP